jgi:copper chaperone CopZ
MEDFVEILYKLEGMTCGHCVASVEKEFSKEGFSAKADRIQGIVTLDKELTDVNFRKIQQILSEEGFSLGERI